MDSKVPCSQAGYLASVPNWYAKDHTLMFNGSSEFHYLDADTRLYDKALKDIGVSATIVVHDS